MSPSVIIHEASHFIANGGSKFPINFVMFGGLIPSPKAEDYVFGTAKCKALARKDPATAILNADNYEYFAETMWETNDEL